MLSGRGMFIHKIKRCEDGDPEKIAAEAKKAGLSHVLIKILDGPWSYNQRPTYVNGRLVYVDDILSPVVIALQGLGIQVWGWQWLYLDHPHLEATAANKRVREFSLDGFVINAEAPAKGKVSQAALYCSDLDLSVPVGLSSYRYPSYHTSLPWGHFLGVSDLVMPQVYWMGATDAGVQLRRCVKEYRDITALPIVPTGAAFYKRNYWSATPSQVHEFIQVAGELGLPAMNFWEWYYARDIAGMWDMITYAEDPPPGLEERVAALEALAHKHEYDLPGGA